MRGRPRFRDADRSQDAGYRGNEYHQQQPRQQQWQNGPDNQHPAYVNQPTARYPEQNSGRESNYAYNNGYSEQQSYNDPGNRQHYPAQQR